MTTNDKLLEQFMQAGIDKLDIEDLLSDSFIIIDELYKQYVDKSVSNRPGPKSKFSDSEVLAISWVGEIFSIDSENAWYNFVVKHFTYLFHHMPERSRFNRRRRNLWNVTDTIRQKILKNLPYGDILIIDSLPVPICDFKRAHFSKSPLKSEYINGLRATYGHCATKGLGTYLGFKVHLIISQQGLPLTFVVSNADVDDRDVLPFMIADFLNTIIIGDKGYISEALRQELHDDYGISLLTQKRSNQKDTNTRYVRKTINRLRKRVEVTNNQLDDQFNLSKVRARSHWGFLTRVCDKFAGFTLGAFLNLTIGRPMLALKDLAFA
jgi:hypothetical protein